MRVIPIEWSWWVTANNACEPGEHLIVLPDGDNESDLVRWSLLLLAATVRSFAHMPHRISDHNSTFCVCTFHDGCKQGIDQQIFNRKSISRKITHPQSWNLQAKFTGEKLKGWSNSREKTNSRLQLKNFVIQAHKSQHLNKLTYVKNTSGDKKKLTHEISVYSKIKKTFTQINKWLKHLIRVNVCCKISTISDLRITLASYSFLNHWLWFKKAMLNNTISQMRNCVLLCFDPKVLGV